MSSPHPQHPAPPRRDRIVRPDSARSGRQAETLLRHSQQQTTSDRIDEASAESMDASDPPAFSSDRKLWGPN
ncbi:hypothetical protein [Solimonas marina]|uniref:Uncharacterized protein n=1 Tax=Solimonas marina TaxID=2714601 RepID=A0A969WDN5_9GAMM|nr:hypothetical protein [Solimonas marina]NKF23476.1 hypothetical protein [Solimonas marina]